MPSQHRYLTIVSESGLYTSDEFNFVSQAGARAVLIGESLLKQNDMGVEHQSLPIAPVQFHPESIMTLTGNVGLDYPGVRPEHSYLKDIGRAEYYSVTDFEALAAFQRLAKLEGIIPALETAHAIAYLDKLCPQIKNNARIVINCSGRGDKDVQTVAKVIKTVQFLDEVQRYVY